MKKLPAVLIIVSFIFWILPLGVFIKPSLEKLACDGQRAMCMCHALVFKSSDKAMGPGMILKAAPSTNKENPSGSSNYFVSAKPIIMLKLHSASIFDNQIFYYKNPFLSPLETVPKA